MKRNIIAGILAAGMLTMAGCGGSRSAQLQFTDTTIQVTVTEINGEELIVAVGSGGSIGMPGNMELPDDMEEGELPDDMEADEPPEDMELPENGELPFGGMGAGTGSGASATLKISDESILDAPLSDITENSQLQITFDADGSITSIAVNTVEMNTDNKDEDA